MPTNTGQFRKGEPRAAGAGRVKGTPNRTTVALKEAILASFDKTGGVDYLVWLSKEHPGAYATFF